MLVYMTRQAKEHSRCLNASTKQAPKIIRPKRFRWFAYKTSPSTQLQEFIASQSNKKAWFGFFTIVERNNLKPMHLLKARQTEWRQLCFGHNFNLPPNEASRNAKQRKDRIIQLSQGVDASQRSVHKPQQRVINYGPNKIFIVKATATNVSTWYFGKNYEAQAKQVLVQNGGPVTAQDMAGGSIVLLSLLVGFRNTTCTWSQLPRNIC